MSEKEPFNVTTTLMEIKTEVARISAKLDDLNGVSSKAEKALSAADENQRDIDRLTKVQNWIITTIVAGIAIPVLMILIKSWLTK
ncbi:hemolysin XhlA [Lentilactobacillus sunkii]|jgi:predicted  nucleic acid-binding Zn-ribbon protein|uniref:Hemolysin XhlA n=1 Tax=Lentilactobacillus sunkii TaxID=481719 RepID=A0A1E7XG56_9LACO|nr:hemolysin XhlA family protein [Lentilactobacillus sunkii]OFA12077.1 hemolysin XhlA [Lentilactobacillus sunkii]